MSIMLRLRSALAVFSGRAERPAHARARQDEAFLVFADTGEVLRAERTLEKAGISVRVMGPPPALRTGCDMVLVLPLAKAFAAATLLEAQRLPPLRMVPVGEEMLEPVSLYIVKDYGAWLMVRAANMKVTVEKASGRVVNVSGGGCPDVPFLAAQLVGKTIDNARVVQEHGHTLCGYALHLAVTEAVRLLASGEGKKHAHC